MIPVKTINEIREFLKKEKLAGKRISFVPTMGALHDGHVALFKRASQLADISVVSIFVNKAQFNDPKDYEKYPRQITADLEILKNAGVNYAFIPDHREIFPEDFSLKISSNTLTNCLCGSARPGHFEGVALIVSKLFNIIKPDSAIFGEKDFQQLLIIKKLVCDLNFEVEIFGEEIQREKSGLAISSRNQRLSALGKIKAAEIFKTLLAIKKDPQSLTRKRKELLEKGFQKIDYLEIRDEKNLNLVADFAAKIPARIFIAVYLDGVRLIDNMPL